MKEFGILFIVAAVLLIGNPKLLEKVESLFGNEPVKRERFVVPVDMRQAVAPIVFYDIERPDARKLATFYRLFAEEVEKHGDTFGSVEDVRTWNARNGETHCPGIKGKYPGLGDSVDNILATGIEVKRYADGTFETVTLNDAARKNLVVALRSLVWVLER